MAEPRAGTGLAFRLGSSVGASLPVTGVGWAGQMALSLSQTGALETERPDPPRAALQLALQAGLLGFLPCAPSWHSFQGHWVVVWILTLF